MSWRSNLSFPAARRLTWRGRSCQHNRSKGMRFIAIGARVAQIRLERTLFISLARSQAPLSAQLRGKIVVQAKLGPTLNSLFQHWEKRFPFQRLHPQHIVLFARCFSLARRLSHESSFRPTARFVVFSCIPHAHAVGNERSRRAIVRRHFILDAQVLAALNG